MLAIDQLIIAGKGKYKLCTTSTLIKCVQNFENINANNVLYRYIGTNEISPYKIYRNNLKVTDILQTIVYTYYINILFYIYKCNVHDLIKHNNILPRNILTIVLLKIHILIRYQN